MRECSGRERERIEEFKGEEAKAREGKGQCKEKKVFRWQGLLGTCNRPQVITLGGCDRKLGQTEPWDTTGLLTCYIYTPKTIES